MLDRFNPASWTIAWDAAAMSALAIGIGLFVALLLHRIVFAILNRIGRMSATTIDEMVFAKLYSPIRWSMVAIAISLVAQIDPYIGRFWETVARFIVPLMLGWVALAIVKAFALALEQRMETIEDIAAARSRKTRIAILSRTAIFAIVLITVALMLLGIPGVRDVGATMLASAGLAALAVGAAAQPALKSLIAGLQMAITEPLRLGDMVVVDGHTGRVEEIRMSYVIVRTWDERAIVVPTANFLDDSFENWSRQSEKLTGPVFLHLDPASDIAPIRAELERFVETQELWDGRTVALVMTEANPESIELRVSVSANTIGDLWNLRCAVREHMLAWLRKEMPDALIRHRLEVEAANARVKK